MSDPIDLREFLSGFVAEADDHLRSCRSGLTALDEAASAERPDPRSVRQVYRGLHTIKGLAAMVGVQPVVDIAHRMETVLRAADHAGGQLDARAIEPLVRGLEALEARVQAAGKGETAAPAPAKLLEELEGVQPADALPEAVRGIRLALPPALAEKLTAAERAQIGQGVREGHRALRVDFVPSPARATEGLTITEVRAALTELGDLVRVLPVSVDRSDDAPGGLAFVMLLITDATDEQVAQASGMGEEAALAPLVEVTEGFEDEGIDDEEEGAAAGLEGSLGRNLVRVPVGRIDFAMQSLSALVVTRFKLFRVLSDMQARGMDVRALRAVADEHTRQLRDMREAILGLRMVPVAELLERLPLIVRGLRSSTGKTVHVELGAGRAELDKSVAEQVFPALVHLVRNAVDHGIEPPAARRAAGKPEEGHVRVTVSEPAGDRLDIEVADDGGGVDAAAVAKRVGLPVPEDDRALLDVLVRPGLSTRDEATTTSGRGMGMDIVHRVVVRELGGELLLRNDPGRGTSFVIRIPLTVAIIDTLAFACAEQSFVVPLGSVDEVLDASDVRLVTAPSPADPDHPPRMIERRGEVAPFLSLSELFELGTSDGGKVMMVRRDGALYAFGVDRMLGQQEVVVRPLSDPLVRVHGVTGSTDLGDGRPTLVLDLFALSAELASADERRAP